MIVALIANDRLLQWKLFSWLVRLLQGSAVGFTDLTAATVTINEKRRFPNFTLQ